MKKEIRSASLTQITRIRSISGRDSVRQGKFSFTFMVPKDISYSNKQGKLNLYASDEVNKHEAQGSFLNYIVGGTADNAEADTIGPEIRQIYLNDSSFVEGDQGEYDSLFCR